MPEVDPNGVDLAQVRRMLALSPAERLRVLESALASMMRVRERARFVAHTKVDAGCRLTLGYNP